MLRNLALTGQHISLFVSLDIHLQLLIFISFLNFLLYSNKNTKVFTTLSFFMNRVFLYVRGKGKLRDFNEGTRIIPSFKFCNYSIFFLEKKNIILSIFDKPA